MTDTPDHWTLDPLARRLARNGQAVALGERAFELLTVLAESSGRVVGTDALLARVWPGRVVEENNLHVHVAALRRLLGDAAIRTVRGRGYQLTVTLGAPAATRPAANAPHDLIGRDADLAALRALLARHRSVTLTGPGGVGKTRLALAACAAEEPPDVTCVVELTGVDASTPVAEAVARALGLALPGVQASASELLDLLRARPLLLLLDNCEHRADEAGRLVQALATQTAQVRVLATSQVSLAPLAPPDAQALFNARVAAQDPGFSATPAQAADVAAICAGLDGLPLALELAAARVGLLGLRALRERLDAPLHWLGGGPRGAPERQQTLRGAIAWSDSLLSPAERQTFHYLGVFAGSFAVPLALALLGDEAQALDRLQSLRDKSLLVALPRDRDGGEADDSAPRLRLLDSTRSFAREQLQARHKLPGLHQRLARALLGVFERGSGPRAFEPGARAARAAAAELDNLRGTLDALAAQPDQAALHIELAGCSGWIWSRLGLRAEGLRRCRLALGRVDAGTPPRLEARLQFVWASLAHRRGAEGDIAAAARAAALYEALGDRLGQFRALSVLSFTHALNGDEPGGMASLEALAEAFDPGWGPVQWAAHLAITGSGLAQLGRDAEALQLCRQHQQLIDSLTDDHARAAALVLTAQLAYVTGDLPTAVERAEQAVAAARRDRAGGRLGLALGDLAAYRVAQGRVDEALPLAREAIALRARDGTLGAQLDQLAELAAARGHWPAAAMALGRADVHHAGRQGRRERYLRPPHQHARELLERALPAAELRHWQVRGAAMGDDEVARLTLAD
jgi:predicted ATPase/DNA-binding winged helix-turn-helix (wHTH) protein